jgi:DNA-binding NarL/FixJ family response regulator
MKEAAYVLNVTMSTVAFHKVRIREVLNAKNDADLVQYAMRNYMIATDFLARIR